MERRPGRSAIRRVLALLAIAPLLTPVIVLRPDSDRGGRAGFPLYDRAAGD